MNQDYVTQLRLQLREAALREERRSPLAGRAARVRRGLPGPAPLAAALALALFALAIALGVLQLRSDSEPVKPRVIQTFRVADNLLSLSGGFGAAWASDTVAGRVLRIDPKTRKVTARIDPSPPSTGRAAPTAPAPADVQVIAGAGAVWALTGDLLTSGSQGPVELARIDPRTNRVVTHIPMRSPSGDNFAPQFLVADDRYVWVIGGQGALRIDPARNAADRFVAYAPGGGTVAEGERVWTFTPDARLRELDARSGRVVHEVRLNFQGIEHLFPGPPGALGLLGLAGSTDLALIDRNSGTALWHADLGDDLRAVTYEGDDLWAHVSRAPDGPDRLVRLDAGTGRRTGEVKLRNTDAVALDRIGDELWIAEPGGTISVVR
jgi:hypothetical protein